MAPMPIVPLFLLKLSVSLAAVWCFYQVVLRRLTFYNLNRWYLLGYTLLSFFIPFINIGPMLPDGPAGGPIVIQLIPAIGGVSQGSVVPVTGHTVVSGWTILLWVVAAGSVLLLARMVVRWVSLVRLRRKARLIEVDEVKIYQVDGPVTPFSFGNAIFINRHLYSDKEWADIILHEYVHIREKHTIDILLMELVCILNWYNPFAWLIRYSVRQNLEFVADQRVLEKGVDRRDYQYHLLKVVGESRYRLANNFNFSSLKKRIIMMNKIRSARVHLLKLLFVLPLVAVLLVAFRDRDARLFGSHGPIYVNTAGIVISLPGRTPLEGVLVRDRGTGLQVTTDAEGYYKLKIPAVADSTVQIHLTFAKVGYDSTFAGRYWPAITKTQGLMLTGALIQQSVPFKGVFSAFPGMPDQQVPIDPGYADAEKELNLVLKENDDVMKYLQMEKDHPEVSLFYETEDGQKEIIVHTDGTIERYGYPGTPALDEMVKKYGDMQGYMATNHPTGPRANSGYLARWEAIGEEAQREFHTTNPNVRAIIFPGDSRVIVVPVSGKTRFYDMDNDAGNERAEFERLYGKLPDAVPNAGFNSDEMERAARSAAPHAAGAARDTVPVRGKETSNVNRPTEVVKWQGGSITVHRDSMALIGNFLGEGPLFIVDGKEAAADTLRLLNPNRIQSITVLKDSASIGKYGEKGRNGVILIHMKGPLDMEKVGLLPVGRLYIVDGREMDRDSVSQLNSREIESVNVLKGEPARAKYGEKGKDGVILITLKHPGGAGAMPRGQEGARVGNGS
jgi:beta-lactamase regulating signal transducer with metallopeptidase domain